MIKKMLHIALAGLTMYLLIDGFLKACLFEISAGAHIY